MPLKIKAGTAVCAAALLVAVGTFAVRAQDAAQPPAAEAAPTPAPAAPAPPADPAAIVARVGDQTVTEAEVAIARDEFGSELGQVPEAEQRSVLIDALVNMELLAQAARDAGLDKGPDFQNQLEFLRMQALRNAYVEQSVVNALTAEDLTKGYETLILAEFKPQEQLHARHILVDTKEAAEKIIADLKGGASFEELAKQSKDPSGQNGGDLGFFGRGQMVPAFETAAFALQPGAVTEAPVQTEFGWHVIRLEEKRMSEPPKIEEVEGELRNYLLRQKFEGVMTSLRDKYAVEIVGEPAESAPPPAEVPAAGEPAAQPPAATEQPQPQN